MVTIQYVALAISIQNGYGSLAFGNDDVLIVAPESSCVRSSIPPVAWTCVSDAYMSWQVTSYLAERGVFYAVIEKLRGYDACYARKDMLEATYGLPSTTSLSESLWLAAPLAVKFKYTEGECAIVYTNLDIARGLK